MSKLKPTVPLTLKSAPAFTLPDHQNAEHTLERLSGSRGVVLGFLGDIWRPITLQRILGLQRYASRLARLGWQTAVILRDQPRTLANFHLSSPLPVPFPLLADRDGRVHEAYMLGTSAGLLMVDHARLLRCKWYLSEPVILPPLVDLQMMAASLDDRPAHSGR